MNARTDHVLLEALALERDERALVALSLLDSLQGDGDSDDAVSHSWLAEAKRRSDGISSGQTPAISLGEFQTWFNAL